MEKQRVKKNRVKNVYVELPVQEYDRRYVIRFHRVNDEKGQETTRYYRMLTGNKMYPIPRSIARLLAVLNHRSIYKEGIVVVASTGYDYLQMKGRA